MSIPDDLARSAREPPAGGQASVSRLLPWLVAVAFFMESLDTTILNTAVPAVAAALKIAPLSMKAVLSSYALSVALFVPVSGWLADRCGTRRVFVTAIATFVTGSLLCGLSTDIHILVMCRILQGLGGALMVPVGRLTLVRAFPRSELVRAMSFVAIPSLIGPMLGPVAGGLIVHYLHWRVIFFVNLPIGLLGLYLVWRNLPDYREDNPAPLDWVGLVLFGSGLALLSYVLEVFGEHALSGREMVGLLFISMTLLTAYARHALTAAHPLLRLSLVRIRTFRVAIGGSFVTRLGAGGVPFLLPLLYQVVLGFTPVQAALLLLPQPLAAIGLKVIVPRILERFGYRRVLLCNTVLLGLVIASLAAIGPSTPVVQVIVLGLLFGCCSSLQYTSLNALVYADITDPDASMASTMASTMQQMSMSFGVAVASLVAALFIADRSDGNVAELMHGVHGAFVALGALTIVSASVFAGLSGNDGASVARRSEAVRRIEAA